MAELGQTKVADLVKSEIMVPIVSARLKDKLRLAEFADMDYTLVGQPGDSITMSAYEYMGDARVIPEGEEIPIEKLKANKKSVSILKIAKGAEITDEAVLSTMGDPVKEIANQIGDALANGIDNAIIEEAQKAKLVFGGTPTTVDTINSAIELFNDEDPEPMVLFINPKDASKLRKDATTEWTKPAEFGDEVVVKGAFGEVLGATVVRSRKIKEGEAFIAKKGALRVFVKRAALIETERYASRKTTGIFGDEHYAAYLYDESKVVKIGGAAPEGA